MTEEMVVDPIELAIFRSAVHSVAEEMGAALRRTALSPNIKERRDYSCAVFDSEARVIAMGEEEWRVHCAPVEQLGWVAAGYGPAGVEDRAGGDRAVLK